MLNVHLSRGERSNEFPPVLPMRQTSGSFGYDLATSRNEVIAPHATVILPTSLKLERPLPDTTDGRLAMLVLPRSSLTLRYNLIIPNSPGLVDADYTGEIGVIVHNLGDKDVLLPMHTRVAQLIFVTVHTPDVHLHDWSEPKGRPERAGFGSTGA